MFARLIYRVRRWLIRLYTVVRNVPFLSLSMVEWLVFKIILLQVQLCCEFINANCYVMMIHKLVTDYITKMITYFTKIITLFDHRCLLILIFDNEKVCFSQHYCYNIWTCWKISHIWMWKMVGLLQVPTNLLKVC